MYSLVWVAVFFIALCVAYIAYLVLFDEEGGEASPYQRRRFLMDSNAEFGLFKVLVELYGDKYYIFPQVHYSHLLEPKTTDWGEGRRLMSRLDRKSADFVLCDKEHVVPQLVIEVDGPAHKTHERTRARDELISAAIKGTGLPVLHIPVGPYTPESIKKEVDTALATR